MTFFKLLRQSPLSARIGMAMILINIVAAIFAPLICPYGETEIVGDVWLGPSADNLLGTDHLGRDLFTRLVYGARNTIAIAFITTMLSFIVGTIIGFFAATLKGWTDLFVSRLVDILMAFPTLIFALMVLSVVGTGTMSLIVVIALLDSTRVFRLSRAVAMDIEVMESGAFIDAINAGKIPFHLLGWTVDWPDPTNMLDTHFGPGNTDQFGQGNDRRADRRFVCIELYSGLNRQ